MQTKKLQFDNQNLIEQSTISEGVEMILELLINFLKIVLFRVFSFGNFGFLDNLSVVFKRKLSVFDTTKLVEKFFNWISFSRSSTKTLKILGYSHI